MSEFERNMIHVLQIGDQIILSIKLQKYEFD